MKNYSLFIFFLILIPTQLFADGPFLYSLPFDSRFYPDEEIFEKTKEKGIDYANFEKYLGNNKIELGKKVGLISSLEVFFVLNDDIKPYFTEYREKYNKSLEKKYGTTIPVNERFLITLMNDYQTETPNLNAYQQFVDENPQSRIMQFVNVFAFNFELLYYPEKRKFQYLADFKEKYQDHCVQNFESFDNDVTVDFKNELSTIIYLGSNCYYTVSCLSPDDMDHYGFIYGLTESVIHNLVNAVPIPDMAVNNNAEEIGVLANNWVISEFDLIRELDIDDNHKKLLTYFLSNEVYYFVNNVGTLEFNELSTKAKKGFKQSDFDKLVTKKINKKLLDTEKKAYSDFKNKFSDNISFNGGSPKTDDLKNIFHYLYLNPNELNNIFTNEQKH
jgi:hypothetical protein